MTRLHLPTTRRWIIQLAVLSLLLTQSLGQLHRVLHQPWAATATAAQGTGEPPQAQANDGLFAGHQGSTDCRLFDQLAQADLATPAAPVSHCGMAMAPVATAIAAGLRPVTERSYCARAPPVLA